MDVVADALERMQRALESGASPREARHHAELQTRQEWGGRRSYVAQRPPLAVRADMIGSALAEGRPLAEAFDRAQVPRRTGYRILGRPAR